MRTYGRNSASIWIEIDTDANGFNDDVYLTTVIQTLKLNPGESPFFANHGIPQQQSVAQQIPPDYYAALVQQQYAQYFLSLVIGRSSTYPLAYHVSIISHQGAKFTVNVEVPQ